jgi:hypothetical protein
MNKRKQKSISEYFSFNNKKQNINQTNYEISVNELSVNISSQENNISNEVIDTIECDLNANNDINHSLQTNNSNTSKFDRNSNSNDNVIDISINKFDSPSQPIITFPKINIKNHLRSFNKNWYNNRFWLEYSINKDSVFCFVCRHFNTENREKLFTEIGFNDWKRALEKNKGISKHENSETHRNALFKYESFIKTTKESSIVEIIDKNRVKLIEENRHYIKTITKIILNLAISESALRGDNETLQSLHEGNFLLWLKTIAEYDKAIKSRLKSGPSNAKYTSPKIQNEIIQVLKNIIHNKIINEVKDAQYFTLIADGTRDITKQELMSIVLRYINCGKIKERFLCYIHEKKLDAKSKYNNIVTLFETFNLNFNDLVSQCYDGCSVMSGKYKGLQNLIREKAKCAIYVHCNAHNLNLSLLDFTNSYSNALNYFQLIEKLYVFISSGLNIEVFKEAQLMTYSSEKYTLKRLIETRWNYSYESIVAIEETFSALKLSLEWLSDSKEHDKSVTARGLLNKICDFEFICFLKTFRILLSKINEFFKQMQFENIDYSSVLALLEITKSKISSLRTDETWENIYKKCIEICALNDINIETNSSRSRKIPKNLEQYFVTISNSSSVKTSQFYKINLFFASIDCLLLNISERFDSKMTGILLGISAIHPKSKLFMDFDVMTPFATHYNLNLDDLKQNCETAKILFKDIEDIFNLYEKLNDFSHSMYDLLKFVKICLTIGCVNASCERSFSTLKRVKTYLKNSMTNERLNALALISIERETASTLNLDEFLIEFAKNHCNRKIALL